MFGAIPAEVLLELAKKNGAYYQLDLIETVPRYKIKEEYCCSVARELVIEQNKYGKSYSSLGHVDHPSFSYLREHLEREGYIKTESWWNGDRVLKPFYLNDKLFDEGEQFPCGSAIKYKLFGR